YTHTHTHTPTHPHPHTPTHFLTLFLSLSLSLSLLAQSPLPWVKGLKWGEYVGSPSAPDPVVRVRQPHGERFGSLLALPTRAICGLSRKFCLLMIHSKEQGETHTHRHTHTHTHTHTQTHTHTP